VYAWKTGSIRGPEILTDVWSQYLYDAENTGQNGSTLTAVPRSNEFFPKSLAYNWPNPVGIEHQYKTYIRYFIRDNAEVVIRIFDLAGELVTEFSGPGTGGLDNEIEWDVGNIQSGIYFAHIEARGALLDGSSVIKIAVIK
jgi:hypothetical protein